MKFGGAALCLAFLVVSVVSKEEPEAPSPVKNETEVLTPDPVPTPDPVKEHILSPKFDVQEVEESSNEVSEESDVDLVPVTLEHPLFKIFGINPDDYVIFYKHRRADGKSSQYISLNRKEKERLREDLKITRKREETPENLLEEPHELDQPCKCSAEPKINRNEPFVFALLPYEKLESLMGQQPCGAASMRSRFPYTTAEALVGKEVPKSETLALGIYPAE